MRTSTAAYEPQVATTVSQALIPGVVMDPRRRLNRSDTARDLALPNAPSPRLSGVNAL